MTGPDFERGYELTFETDEAVVKVVGTVFGVDAYDSGTCICCYRGNVWVDPADPVRLQAASVPRSCLDVAGWPESPLLPPSTARRW